MSDLVTTPEPSIVAPVVAESYISNPFVLLWQGFTRLGANLQPLFIVIGLSIALFLAYIPGIVCLVIASSNSQAVLGVIGGLLVIAALVLTVIVGLRLLAVSYLIYLANARRQVRQFKDLYEQSKPLAWPLFSVSVVTALIIIGGLILLIVPGIIFAYWYSLSSYVVVEEGGGVKTALSRSRSLVRGHGWEMYGFYSATQLVGALQAIPLLGYVISVVVGWAAGNATALRYEQLIALPPTVDAKPAISPWNYLAVLAGPLAFILVIVVTVFTNSHK
jgi:hypothetical protein